MKSCTITCPILHIIEPRKKVKGKHKIICNGNDSNFRLNGNEVASFYDQNHESNHKNSMVGQSVLIYCNQGDKVQVYE